MTQHISQAVSARRNRACRVSAQLEANKTRKPVKYKQVLYGGGHKSVGFSVARPEKITKRRRIKRGKRKYDKSYLTYDNHAFIQDPDWWGSWLRVDRSVVDRACPQCGARKGALCVGSSGSRISGTHHRRRRKTP